MSVLVPNINITFVRGFTKGLLVDSYRNHIEFIPSSLIEFVSNFAFKSTENLSSHNYSLDVVNEYVNFLISNEYCFLVESEDEAIGFKRFQSIYDSPHILTNCIFQIGINTQIDDVIKVISELESLQCWFIEFFIDCSLEKTLSIIASLCEKKLKCVFIHCNAEDFSNKSISTLIESIQKISSSGFNKASLVINIYSSRHYPQEIKSNNLYIQIHNKKLPQNTNCGAIKKEYFSIHIENLREALHHNSCLNRKISIDFDGNIKNCPSMPESYGNIKDTTLAEAIEKPGFKKYWDINKDKIHVCKDCEFRYICTDCRAYVEDPEDILSKPLKCGYNPYTGEWSEWSTNPLKQKAIDFYGMREMVEGMNTID